MGVRTRKHAIVLVLPRTDQQYAQRHVAAMARAVREYVAMARWMQPRENDATRVEGTRVLVSLNVLFPNDHDGDMEMARAVTISGQAQNQVPRQIAQGLEADLKKWRRFVGPQRRADTRVGDDRSRCSAFLHLLNDLASQGFEASVIAPADAFPFGDGNCDAVQLKESLTKQLKTQFIILRDEDEDSGAASKNVLELLRGIKSCPNHNCAIRQIEECEIELQGVVKEWLHAAAPVVRAMMILGDRNNQDHVLEVEVRANFVLVQATEAPTPSWMALHDGLSELKFHHFVPLKSVHPAMLLGCPLRASPTTQYLLRGRALTRHICEAGHGGLVSCSDVQEGTQRFYLVVSSPGSAVSGELLLYRLASAEEVLLQDPFETACMEPASKDSDKVMEEIAIFQDLPVQDFNVFRNRSGVLDVVASEPAPRTASVRPSSTRAPSISLGSRPALAVVHEVQHRGSSSSKKKRRL